MELAAKLERVVLGIALNHALIEVKVITLELQTCSRTSEILNKFRYVFTFNYLRILGVQSKSPLWAHLMAYAESEGKEEFQSRKAASVARGPAAETSPDRLRRPHFTSSLSSIAMASTASSNTCKLYILVDMCSNDCGLCLFTLHIYIGVLLINIHKA